MFSRSHTVQLLTESVMWQIKMIVGLFFNSYIMYKY